MTLDPSWDESADRDNAMSAEDLAKEISAGLSVLQARCFWLEVKFRREAREHEDIEDRPASVQYGWGVVHSQRRLLEGVYALALDIEFMAAQLDKEKTPEEIANGGIE